MVHQYACGGYGWKRVREQRGRKYLRAAAGEHGHLHSADRENVPEPGNWGSLHTAFDWAGRKAVHAERRDHVCRGELNVADANARTSEGAVPRNASQTSAGLREDFKTSGAGNEVLLALTGRSFSKRAIIYRHIAIVRTQILQVIGPKGSD